MLLFQKGALFYLILHDFCAEIAIVLELFISLSRHIIVFFPLLRLALFLMWQTLAKLLLPFLKTLC